MRGQFHKAVLLPSICCIAFYGGTQLVGETEASFSSQVTPDSITMSAAIVFPATIKQLEDRAEKVSNNMNHHFKTIVAASPDTLEELHKQLAAVTANEQELILELATLHGIYEELSMYNMEIQNEEVSDIHTYDYVREGFLHVDRLLKDQQAAIDFQQIEASRSSILKQMQELTETEKTSEENAQSKQPQENIDPQEAADAYQETAVNSNQNEQVTAHGEEALEDNK